VAVAALVGAWVFAVTGLVEMPTLSDASAPEGREPSLKSSKIRAQLEMVVAFCAGILGVLTIFWHDWIEFLTGWDPDNHNGSAEWVVVAGLLVIAAVLGLVARRHWRLVTAAPGK
jgi:hypothetical protein